MYVGSNFTGETGLEPETKLEVGIGIMAYTASQQALRTTWDLCLIGWCQKLAAKVSYRLRYEHHQFSHLAGRIIRCAMSDKYHLIPACIFVYT